MAQSIINYPDILGALSPARVNIGFVQAAAATRPAVVRAGAPFEVIVLVQNAGDAPLEVSARVMLPDADTKRARGRFALRQDQLAFALGPAEVGMVSFPAAAHPETAPGEKLRFGVDLDVKLKDKAQRIRTPEGGGLYRARDLTPETTARLDALRSLPFAAVKRGANGLDSVLSVIGSAGSSGQAVAANATYTSVCGLGDYTDDRWLLHAFGPLFQLRTLPLLKRETLLPVLYEATRTRFTNAGFPLENVEATLIAKIMTLILEFASPTMRGHGALTAGRYAVQPYLAEDPLVRDEPAALPHWARAYLRLILRDVRAAGAPVQLMGRYVYDALLRDALEFGFEQVTSASGTDLGTPEEIAAFIEDTLQRVTAGGMDFEHAYLPLVMAGIVHNDRLLVERENPSDMLKEISHALEERWRVLRGDDEVEVDDPEPSPVVEMAADLIERTGQKYGYRLGWYDRY